MIDVVAYLSAATICFSNHCYPMLAGQTTPTGDFPIKLKKVKTPGYGGDILAFKENQSSIFAIHRVWTLNGNERRVALLNSGSSGQRRFVTSGCINVMPEIYDKISECCSSGALKILP